MATPTALPFPRASLVPESLAPSEPPHGCWASKHLQPNPFLPSTLDSQTVLLPSKAKLPSRGWVLIKAVGAPSTLCERRRGFPAPTRLPGQVATGTAAGAQELAPASAPVHVAPPPPLPAVSPGENAEAVNVLGRGGPHPHAGRPSSRPVE